MLRYTPHMLLQHVVLLCATKSTWANAWVSRRVSRDGSTVPKETSVTKGKTILITLSLSGAKKRKKLVGHCGRVILLSLPSPSMGAFSWNRDKAGSGKRQVAGAPVVLPHAPSIPEPSHPAKRARVWRREDAQPAVQAQPTQAAQAEASTTRTPADPCSTAGGVGANGAHGNCLQNTTSSLRPATQPAAPAGSLDRGAANSQEASLRAQEDELQALRQRILEKQAQLREARPAGQAVKAAASREQLKQERRQRLETSFAKALADADLAGVAEVVSSKAPVSCADEHEVQRVLHCTSDYEVLKLQPGADTATIKRRYREMAVGLHPDKCRAPHATDAFQRLVRAYQSLLQFAR